MNDAPAVPVIGYADAVHQLNLVNIVALDLQAQALEFSPELTVDELGVINTPEWNVLAQDSDDMFQFRMQLNVASPAVRVYVDAVAVYQKASQFRIDEREQEMLVTYVAIPNIFPFVRQHVSDLSMRLQRPIMLPLVRIAPGEMTLTSIEPEESE